MPAPPARFISEPIAPEPGAFSAQLMSRGLASLPAAFTWRSRRYRIAECLAHQKQSSPEGGRPGADRYLRRQHFHVRLDSGQFARLYFERQPRRTASPRAARQRWFLYTITPEPNDRPTPSPLR